MDILTKTRNLIQLAPTLIHPCKGVPNIEYSLVNNGVHIGFTTPNTAKETPHDFWCRWRDNLAAIVLFFDENGVTVDQGTVTTNFVDQSGYVRFTCPRSSFKHFLEPGLFFAATTREFSKDLSDWKPLDD